MTKRPSSQLVEKTIHKLKHYLPTQSPLKDFIHHNTLHAFQDRDFFAAIHAAIQIFGYKTSLNPKEYLELFKQGKIKAEILNWVIAENTENKNSDALLKKLLAPSTQDETKARIGSLRSIFSQKLHINPDKEVHPILFRLLGNYLDQGISIRPFPLAHKGFITSVREIESVSSVSIFRSARCRHLLLHTRSQIEDLLHILLGDEQLYEHYLFDQQFSHPGWSGLVSVLEDDPKGLYDKREISLHDLIYLELLLEIDALDAKYGENWPALCTFLSEFPEPVFSPVLANESSEAIKIWQEAFEWTYYDEVLKGLSLGSTTQTKTHSASFDALLCIDDRECSFRRHLEKEDRNCRTWGTPGFFNIPVYYQPEHSRFYTKVCPAPITPKHIIRGTGPKSKLNKEAHFTKSSHSLLFGWLISQTLGFWSAFRLFLNIFKPSVSPATSYSFNHMDKNVKLSIENKGPEDKLHGLQVGFTLEEMAERVEGLLKSIGLTEEFADIIYIIGHGASSINNTHYAGYDCGACSGRPGSVNARVVSWMANDKRVRKILKAKGVNIPDTCCFVGALHDTTRDEIEFYDEEQLSGHWLEKHLKNKVVFETALHHNAKERSRRFVLTNTHKPASMVHEKVKLRSVSLFEPRPELNHATNALCIVGRREMTEHLFLDRRAFMNSYDCSQDPDGQYLLNILKAATPVCGGINLEYYFSRVDNQRLGAGTKLPHNVMGLLGVANGADGDLRTGLPWQMVEVHDPVRLLMIVEHYPEVILKVIQSSPETYEWYANNWVNLVAVHPETKSLFRFNDACFKPYHPESPNIPVCENIDILIESSMDNIPVHLIAENA